MTAAASTVDGTDSTTLTAAVTNDQNGAGVTWTVSGGGTLSNQTTTTATYTAPAASSSALTATVTATSVAKSQDSGSATITVPAAPAMTTTNASLAGQVGMAYSVQLQGSGGISPYKNWALASSSSPLPLCVTLSSAGLLSSTNPPSASCAGTFTNLIFTFSDSGTPTALTATSAPMTVAIAAAPAITFPAPSASVPGAGTMGASYNGSVAATGGMGTLTYTLNGTLPGGLTLGAGGAITGKPTAVGTFPFTVTASDAFGDTATSAQYSIGVAYPALTITPASGSLPGATPGTAYAEQTLTASGGSGTGYTWTVTGLPANGLVYAANGATLSISGTPTSPGAISFTVSVTDSAKNSAGPDTYSIGVSYPTLTITPGSESLPGGTAGTAYPEQTLTASGGSGTGYAWTVTGLPADGLDYTANGATLSINGTPNSAETVSFSVSVTDSAKETVGPFAYTIAVASSAPANNNSAIQGTYACLMQGFVDAGQDRYAALASFVADGQGNITSGVYDSNRRGSTPDSGTLAGSYTVGTDGNGTMTANLTSTVTSAQVTRTYGLAVTLSATPAQQVSLVESDDAGSTPSGQHAMGNCYLTTPSAFAASTLSGNSFVLAMGGENGSGAAKASAGQITFASSGMTITSGAADGPTAGTTTVAFLTITGGSFTTPSTTTGRTQLTMTATESGETKTETFVVYLIDANRALALETDTAGGLSSGIVQRQQQSSYSAAEMNGAFVFYTQALEFETSGSITPTGYYSIIYQGTGNGSGDLAIAQSYMNENGTYTSGQTAGSVSVTFDASVPGRATLGTGSGTTILYFYNTNSALEVSGGGGSSPVEAGRVEPQTQTTFTDAALAGTYMMTEMVPLEFNALDLSGELTVGNAGTLGGQMTEGGQGAYQFDQSTSGTYAWDTTVTGTGTFLAPSPVAWSCAAINATRFVCMDQTATPPAIRIFQQ